MCRENQSSIPTVSRKPARRSWAIERGTLCSGLKRSFFLHKSIVEHHKNILPKSQDEMQEIKAAIVDFATE